MHFRWDDQGDGRVQPILRAAIRRNGKSMPHAPYWLIDTGADGTTLPLKSAKFLDIPETDLQSEDSTSPAGPGKVFVPRNLGDTEIHLCGRWLRLRTLVFTAGNQPLIGRDLLFEHFNLMMSGEDFVLNWTSRG